MNAAGGRGERGPHSWRWLAAMALDPAFALTIPPQDWKATRNH